MSEIQSVRAALKQWAAQMPLSIRLRAGHVEKNLKACAADPTDAAPFRALVKNVAELEKMKRAITSEE